MTLTRPSTGTAPHGSGSTAAATSATTTATTTPALDSPAVLAHDCDPETQHAASEISRATRTNRYIGIDAARGFALLGMVAVHTISSVTAEGDQSVTWQLFSGRSAALFAVLGGAGIAFMTGRNRIPRGAAWARAAATPFVRGVLMILIGLALGYAVSAESALVILPYLGLMFMASTLLLPFRPRTLITFGLAWAVAAPVISHLLRAGTAPVAATNLTFDSVVSAPGATLVTLLLTGGFPVLTWMSYIAIGLGVGRAALTSRRIIAWLVGGGAALWLLTEGISRALVAFGLRERIAADVSETTTLDGLMEYVVWGGEGVLPTDSPWWLGINSAHTGAPLDLLSTAALALLVIGLFLTLAMAMGSGLRPLAAPGSMTLTLYTAHVLLIGPTSELPDVAAFALHVVVLIGFALLWSSRFSKGPLEWVVATITKAVTPAKTPPPRAEVAPATVAAH